MTSTIERQGEPPASAWPTCLAEYIEFVRGLVEKGGPLPEADEEVHRVANSVFRDLNSGVLVPEDIHKLRQAFGDALSSATLQGHALIKPFGYPGDFQLFDKMYLGHVSDDPRLHRWDEFFHRLDACKAVCNRKTWLIDTILAKHARSESNLRVLIVGSGPGRAVVECLQSNPRAARFDCVELDPKAIDYASDVCEAFSDRVRFIQGSILRYRTETRYDLIWSGGLFDYFNDRVFARALSHLLALTTEDGEVIIGNFAAPNSSQGFMELISDWKLKLRTPSELTELATSAGITPAQVRIENEPTGTNLFLRIARG